MEGREVATDRPLDWTERPVADPGGGGVQGVRPPLLGHDVGFLTLGPKLDPPFLLVDLRCSGGSGGGGGDRGDHPPPPLNLSRY